MQYLAVSAFQLLEVVRVLSRFSALGAQNWTSAHLLPAGILAVLVVCAGFSVSDYDNRIDFFSLVVSPGCFHFPLPICLFYRLEKLTDIGGLQPLEIFLNPVLLFLDFSLILREPFCVALHANLLSHIIVKLENISNRLDQVEDFFRGRRSAHKVLFHVIKIRPEVTVSEVREGV